MYNVLVQFTHENPQIAVASDFVNKNQCNRFTLLLYDVYFSFSHQIKTRKVKKNFTH